MSDFDDMVTTITKTIDNLPAERRLYPDLYAETVAQALEPLMLKAARELMDAVAQHRPEEYPMSQDDLPQRLRRAVARLEELRDLPGQGRYEKVRLDGKIDGVKLAASYLEEGTRIFSPEAEPADDAL